MKPGMLFLIARDIIGNFIDAGVLLADGSVVKPDAHQDAVLVGLVIATLNKLGIHTPKQIDAVVSMLPLIFQLAELK